MERVRITVGGVPQKRDLPTAIHERLSPCKSNTQPLKDSFFHLKGGLFFLADCIVASLSSVHRYRAELRVRPAIHSGWPWTDNLTESTRPMISSGAGGPFTESVFEKLSAISYQPSATVTEPPTLTTAIARNLLSHNALSDILRALADG